MISDGASELVGDLVGTVVAVADIEVAGTAAAAAAAVPSCNIAVERRSAVDLGAQEADDGLELPL